MAALRGRLFKEVALTKVKQIESNVPDPEWEAQVTDYIEGGMEGCLHCDQDSEGVRIEKTDISDDGSRIDIHHVCDSCGAEWMVEYVAVGIYGRKVVDSQQDLN
jgi:hypothetical protein